MTCTHHWTVTSECPMCLRSALDAALARANALAAQFDRLPPYDEEGFYIDHGQWGRESVSVADVMDSLRGALAAIDAARAQELQR